MRGFGSLRAAALVLGVLTNFAVPGVAGPGLAQPRASYQDLPLSVDPAGRYLFYMHGRVVERGGRQAVSKHGRYYYDEIVQALAGRGFVVISEVRSPETTLGYGRKVAAQVRQLMVAGVAPERITVSGFSKGGFLTIVASAELGHPKVNFVVMAGCGIGPHGQIVRDFAPRMRGRVLSLYDRADGEAGSCRDVFSRAPGLEHRETALSTGLGHGLFYAPHREWLDLLVEWATPGR